MDGDRQAVLARRLVDRVENPLAQRNARAAGKLDLNDLWMVAQPLNLGRGHLRQVRIDPQRRAEAVVQRQPLLDDHVVDRADHRRREIRLRRLRHMQNAAGNEDAVIDVVLVEKVPQQQRRVGMNALPVLQPHIRPVDPVRIPPAQRARAAVARSVTGAPRLRQTRLHPFRVNCRVNVGIDQERVFVFHRPANPLIWMPLNEIALSKKEENQQCASAVAPTPKSVRR